MKCSLFSDFHYGFRSSQSTEDLLTIVFDKVASLLIDLELFELYHLIYQRLLTEFGMLVLSHKSKSCCISGRIFAHTLSFLSNRQLRVALDGQSSQEYPLNTGVPQGSIFGPTLFLLYIRPCIVKVHS